MGNLFNEDYVNVKAPGGWGFSGSVENFSKAGKIGLGIGAGAGFGIFVYKAGKRALNFLFGEKEEENKHRRKMEEQELAHKLKMEEEAHKSNLKKEEMNLEQEQWRERHPQKEAPVAESETETSAEGEEVDDDVSDVKLSWLDNFQKKFKMPALRGILDTLINGVCPIGYEPAMLLHLLSMFGALCFSKVRAKYLDGILHAPNLQVIIEGGWGTGKGKFETVYKLLFARIIDADKEKINRSDANGEDDYPPIVQTAGIGLSGAKLVDVLADNQGVHSYIFSSEILAVILNLQKKTGLTFDHFRKAFENGDIYNNNKAKKSKKGMYPVFLNYTFTGTPGDTAKFNSRELEGGTSSRICYGIIPEHGKDIPNLDMPCDAELDEIRDQIDAWKSQYCYTTNNNGEDIPCEETVIDLDYVNEALKKWLDEQFELSEQEKNPARANARTRMAAIAFHAAIVIAMMYGNPSAKEHAKRKAVVDLVIYVANHCMERFLYKFGDIQNAQRAEALKAEKAKTETFETSSNAAEDGITDETVAEWYRLNHLEGEERMGYGTIAKKYGTTKSVVRGRIQSYESKLNK